MIKDLVVGFEKAQQKYPSIVLDNYELKEGIYLRLDVSQSWEKQKIAFDQNHVPIGGKDDKPFQSTLVDWFKKRDYCSSLITMNKPVDLKKQIHSNNPFSLFVKKEVLLGEKQDAKFSMMENVERYLIATTAPMIVQKWRELIPNEKKKSSKEKKQLHIEKKSGDFLEELEFFQQSEYKAALVYLNDKQRSQWIEEIMQWYRNNLVQLTQFIIQQPFKKYVKIFFTLDSFTNTTFSCDEIYDFEYLLYTIPKIYNNNDYNQIIAGNLVGLPSFDMTMNSKKPFMEHKTMGVKVSDRIPLQDALLVKDTMGWVAAQPKYKTNKFGYESTFSAQGRVPLAEGAFHVYMDGKDNELHGFENVPFSPTIQIEMEWLNILQMQDQNGDLKYYDKIIQWDDLQKKINSKFFRGRMHGAFLFDEPTVKSKEFTAVMVALFLQSRQAFHDWFHKGTTLSLRGIFGNVTLRLITEQMLHVETTRMEDLADAFNLRLSIQMLINEEGGHEMGDRIKETIDTLREKLKMEGLVVCESDNEFYFMAGQLAYYLIYQSEAMKKTGAMTEPFLRAKNGEQLKKRLEETYMLYKHGILMEYRRFNNAFSMVMGYVPKQSNEGSARELLLAGLFASNLLLEKKDKGEQ